jgi:hypothetical protein
MTADARRSAPWRVEVPPERGHVVWNEFAAVEVAVDLRGLTPRLRVEDLDSGAVVYLDPLELATFANTPEALRSRWLNVGPYRG